MVEVFTALVVLAGVFVLLPVVSYLVVKFGAAGYFRAKSLFHSCPPPGSEEAEDNHSEKKE